MSTTNFACLLAFLLCAGATTRAQDKKLTGYTDAAAITQLQLESKFDKQLSSNHIGETIRSLSTHTILAPQEAKP